MLGWREDLPGGAHLAVTDREGGASSGAWAGPNLGDHVGDDPGVVAGNRRAVAQALGVGSDRLLFARQVHGTAVVVADGPWDGGPPDADALVTRTPGLALGMLVADCVPLLLAAPSEGIVAVAHAGRRGMAEGVVPAVLAAMRSLGARRIVGRVGPSICARCYEVPAAMRAEVAAVVPAAWAVTRHGMPALDISAGVVEQAREKPSAGASVEVTVLPGCTAERPDLYSFRRDGVTGRFAGLAWIDP